MFGPRAWVHVPPLLLQGPPFLPTLLAVSSLTCHAARPGLSMWSDLSFSSIDLLTPGSLSDWEDLGFWIMVQDVKRFHFLFRPKPRSASDLTVGLSVDTAVLSHCHVIIAERRSRIGWMCSALLGPNKA